MKWASDELKICGIYLIVIVAWITIHSIKEREEIIPNLVEFFGEWWVVIKRGIIFLVILLILSLPFAI